LPSSRFTAPSDKAEAKVCSQAPVISMPKDSPQQAAFRSLGIKCRARQVRLTKAGIGPVGGA